MAKKLNKTGLKKILTDILHKYKWHDVVSPEDFTTLMTYFPSHHGWESEKCPHPLKVVSIHIDKRSPTEKYCGFWLDRNDGSTIDIGIPSVVNGYFGSPSTDSRELVATACRSVVKPMFNDMRARILEVGQGKEFTSQLTGEKFVVNSGDDFHIDHYDKDFSELVRMLIERHPDLLIDTTTKVIDSSDCDNTNGKVFADKSIAEEFNELHWKNTNLRVLPPSENLARSKTRIKSDERSNPPSHSDQNAI